MLGALAVTSGALPAQQAATSALAQVVRPANQGALERAGRVVAGMGRMPAATALQPAALRASSLAVVRVSLNDGGAWIHPPRHGQSATLVVTIHFPAN